MYQADCQANDGNHFPTEEGYLKQLPLTVRACFCDHWCLGAVCGACSRRQRSAGVPVNSAGRFRQTGRPTQAVLLGSPATPGRGGHDFVRTPLPARPSCCYNSCAQNHKQELFSLDAAKNAAAGETSGSITRESLFRAFSPVGISAKIERSRLQRFKIR